jgi:TolB-like protein
MQPLMQTRSPRIHAAMIAALVLALSAGGAYAWTHASHSSASRAAREPPVIVVSSFRTIGPDLEPWSGNGLTHEIEHALGEMRGVVVRRRRLDQSSPAAAPIRNEASAATLAASGRSLGADFVLAGTVARIGARSEIGVRLVRVRDGEQLWSGTFWRATVDLGTLPGELAAAVIGALPRDAGRTGSAGASR